MAGPSVPQVPAVRRSQLLFEKQMGTLEQMGVTAIGDPGDDEAGPPEEYIGQVVEHVKHALCKSVGAGMPLARRTASDAAKRRRA